MKETNAVTYSVTIPTVKTAHLCKSLENGTSVINRGFVHGVQVGTMFYLPDGEPEPIVDPSTKETIGYHIYEVLRLEVINVFENYSYCKGHEVPFLNQRDHFFGYEGKAAKSVNYEGRIVKLVEE